MTSRLGLLPKEILKNVADRLLETECVPPQASGNNSLWKFESGQWVLELSNGGDESVREHNRWKRYDRCFDLSEYIEEDDDDDDDANRSKNRNRKSPSEPRPSHSRALLSLRLASRTLRAKTFHSFATHYFSAISTDLSRKNFARLDRLSRNEALRPFVKKMHLSGQGIHEADRGKLRDILVHRLINCRDFYVDRVFYEVE